jgi:hypothetical protein
VPHSVKKFRGIEPVPTINGKYYANAQYGLGLERERAADPDANHGAHARESLASKLADWISPQPGAPPGPKAPGVAPEAWDYAKINELTVRQVANIVANENHDVTPGKSTPEVLQEARIAQAHAVINAYRNLGPKRTDNVGTADDEVTAHLENSAQYQQALDAARTAFQEQLAGKDRVQGRMWFNNRSNGDTGSRQIGKERVGIFR